MTLAGASVSDRIVWKWAVAALAFVWASGEARSARPRNTRLRAMDVMLPPLSAAWRLLPHMRWSVTPERFHRRDAGRAASRQPDRRCGDGADDAGDRDEGGRIGRRHVVELR